MARRLINEDGYDPQKLQVLLGGWNTWKEKHAIDPKMYPTVPDPLPTPLPVPVDPIQPALPPTATVSK